MADFDFVLKIIILGDNRVGKSSFILRYTENIFAGNQNEPRLFGIDYMTKVIEVEMPSNDPQSKVLKENTYKIKLILWDPAGCEKHRTLNETYYRGSDAVVLMYDISQPLSLEAVAEWVSDVDSHAHKGISKMLLANKRDLRSPENKALLTEEMGSNVANYYDIAFHEVSAKDGTNIEKAMRQLVMSIVQKKLSEGATEVGNLVDVGEVTVRKNTSCC